MKRRVGKCPVCGKQVSVSKHGLVVTHKAQSRSHAGSRTGCPGSGQQEAQS